MIEIAATCASVFGRSRDPKKSELSALLPEASQLLELVVLVDLVGERRQFLLCKVEDRLT